MTRLSRQRLGLLCVAGGVALAFVDVSLPSTIADSGSGVVSLLAIGAVVLGTSYASDRRTVDADLWRPADPEPGYRVPVPGDEVTADERGRRPRLRRRVIVSLVEHGGCSRSEAEARVEAGTWTADRLAAAYVSPDTVRVHPATRLVGFLRREPSEQRAFRRAVAALREVRGDRDA